MAKETENKKAEIPVKKREKRKFEGLWIRNEIFNIRVLGDSEKMLLAHFDSFGTRGCYQSNSTLAVIFLTKPRTIRRRIAEIKKAGLIYIKSPKGYYRTIWVKSNPEVMKTVKLWYRGKEIGKPREDNQDGQKWPTKVDKSGQASKPKGVFRHGQNLATTYKRLDTETNGETAVGLPLAVGGQASQLLADRKAGEVARIEQLKRSFGRSRRRQTPELTAAECEKRRQEQKRALLAVGAE